MKKGQNVVHQLSVTLEEIYMGKTRKLRMRREVIEQGSMQVCSECGGKGMNIRVVRMGPMIQQVQEPCRACEGQGSQYRSSQVQEVMEVVVPKGAPDGYKLTFHEKADEIPNGIPGDVIFVLQEQPHSEFRRKGSDLYVKRKISLVEALCGFRMELTHLDGRKLLIKTAPGQVVSPVAFDPFKDDEEVEWETHLNMDCPELETIAKADTDDVEKLKHVIAKGQLRGKGVGAFRVKDGKSQFYRATAEEVHKSLKPSKGSVLYTLADPTKAAVRGCVRTMPPQPAAQLHAQRVCTAGAASGDVGAHARPPEHSRSPHGSRARRCLAHRAPQASRMMLAVKGEGMPVFKSPMEAGSLFVMLEIEFPSSIDEAAAAALKKALPPPLTTTNVKDDDAEFDVVTLEPVDPVMSYKQNLYDMAGDATQEEEREHGGGGVQCAQQ